MRVLLVEDTIGKPMQSILQSWGHDVVLATDGTTAREHLGHGRFDLFLFDWILPDGSGLELVRTVRADARFRDAPVLMVSSRTDRRDIVTAVRSGIDGYLAKPFRPTELRSRIDEAWQRRNRQRSHRQKVEHVVEGQTHLDRHTEGPLIVLGESAITVEDLEAPRNVAILEHLSTAATTVAAANAFLPDLHLGYCLCDSTGDLTQLLRQRSTCDRVQLAVVSVQCHGNCVVMARLLQMRGAGPDRLCVVCDHWDELSKSERAELDTYEVPVFHRDELDASRWRDLVEMQVIRRWSPKLHAELVDAHDDDGELFSGT